MNADTARSKDNQTVGARLRRLRKKCGLTLKQVADLSGLAVSTISKAELGQVALSYEKFVRLANALRVDVATLFLTSGATPAPAAASVTVLKDDLSRVQPYRTENYNYSLLFGAFPEKRLKPMVATIAARSLDGFEDFIRHAGQEMVIVLSGRVRIAFETGESVTLGRHETAYFDSGVGHVYLSVGKQDAQVLVVCCD